VRYVEHEDPPIPPDSYLGVGDEADAPEEPTLEEPEP
jgi:hypothetical protein